MKYSFLILIMLIISGGASIAEAGTTDELFRRAGDTAVQLASGNTQGAVSNVVSGAVPSRTVDLNRTHLNVGAYGAGLTQPVFRPVQAGPVNFSGQYNAYTGPFYTYPYPNRPPSLGQNFQAQTSSKAFNTNTTFWRDNK